MQKIWIVLTNKGFNKCYLHYDIELDEYYIFVNTKKYNRRLKEIIKKAKKQIYRNTNIISSKKLQFKPLGYERFLMSHEKI